MRKLLTAISTLLLSLLVLAGAAQAQYQWHGQPGSKAYRAWQRTAGSPAHQASVAASQRVYDERNNLGSFGFQQKYGTGNVSTVASSAGYRAFTQTLGAGLRR